MVGIKANHGIGIAESYLSHAARAEGAKYYVYTDRPVYRPGHRLFFKGILRVDDGTALKVKGQHEAEIQVKDPKGRMVQTLKRTSDEMGTLNGHFDLSRDAPLGQYTLWTR